ncbi:hypothetical protein M9Y10_027193 [Tritrichomonas musculus]|uniref:Protein kinase domain-containing protein n=1 Tax=Tritrichomonas musculus TaxID=1915356 RepID=A0ABR2H5R6_9EUKA
MSTSYLQKITNSFTFIFSPKSLPEDIEDDFIIITYQDIAEYGQSFFICLDKSIIIIDKPKFQQFIEIYPKKTYYYIYDFTNDAKNILIEATNSSINLKATKFTINDIQSFISSFRNTKIQFLKNIKKSTHLFNTMLQLIVAHILQKSIMKTRISRIEKAEEFINKKPQINHYKLNEFIKLSNLGSGGSGFVEMAFHIGTEKLYALKNSYQEGKYVKTLEREYDNYSKICCFPFLPRFYGKIQPENYLVIDYIEGLPLNKIKELNLNLFEKIMIILEIMFAVKFLHENNFVYRDLKPDNVIIDHNKTAVLIDFNRMIKQSNDYIGTVDFCQIYMAPEIVNGKPFSYKADIYSIGFLIYYIILEECPDKKIEGNKHIFDKLQQKYQEIKVICENCTQIDHNNRPDIDELIHNFIYYFSFQIILFNADKDENYYIFCKLLSTNTKSSSFKDIYEINI